MKQGLNSLDWLEVSSKIKQANDFQLNFLKEVISSEEIKRKGQQGGL